MNREDIHVCEHCKEDLPRHAVGKVYYCSQECYEAEEGPIDRDTLTDIAADLPDAAACALVAELAVES